MATERVAVPVTVPEDGKPSSGDALARSAATDSMVGSATVSLESSSPDPLNTSSSAIPIRSGPSGGRMDDGTVINATRLANDNLTPVRSATVKGVSKLAAKRARDRKSGLDSPQPRTSRSDLIPTQDSSFEGALYVALLLKITDAQLRKRNDESLSCAQLLCHVAVMLAARDPEDAALKDLMTGVLTSAKNVGQALIANKQYFPYVKFYSEILEIVRPRDGFRLGPAPFSELLEQIIKSTRDLIVNEDRPAAALLVAMINTNLSAVQNFQTTPAFKTRFLKCLNEVEEIKPPTQPPDFIYAEPPWLPKQRQVMLSKAKRMTRLLFMVENQEVANTSSIGSDEENSPKNLMSLLITYARDARREGLQIQTFEDVLFVAMQKGDNLESTLQEIATWGGQLAMAGMLSEGLAFHHLACTGALKKRLSTAIRYLDAFVSTALVSLQLSVTRFDYHFPWQQDKIDLANCREVAYNMVVREGRSGLAAQEYLTEHLVRVFQRILARTQTLLGSAPYDCAMAVLGMGSMSMSAMSPNSDLEFCAVHTLVMDEDYSGDGTDVPEVPSTVRAMNKPQSLHTAKRSAIQKYYEDFFTIAELNVIFTGETTPVQNDVSYSVGFRLDDGGNTPLTKSDLLGTCARVMHNLVPQGDGVKDLQLVGSLPESGIVFGDQNVFQDYRRRVVDILRAIHNQLGGRVAEVYGYRLLQEGTCDLVTPHPLVEGLIVDAKASLYRPSATLLSSLGLICGMGLDGSEIYSSITIEQRLSNLQARGFVAPRIATSMRRLLNFAARIRIQAHVHLKTQNELCEWAERDEQEIHGTKATFKPNPDDIALWHDMYLGEQLPLFLTSIDYLQFLARNGVAQDRMKRVNDVDVEVNLACDYWQDASRSSMLRMSDATRFYETEGRHILQGYAQPASPSGYAQLRGLLRRNPGEDMGLRESLIAFMADMEQLRLRPDEMPDEQLKRLNGQLKDLFQLRYFKVGGKPFWSRIHTELMLDVESFVLEKTRVEQADTSYVNGNGVLSGKILVNPHHVAEVLSNTAHTSAPGKALCFWPFEPTVVEDFAFGALMSSLYGTTDDCLCMDILQLNSHQFQGESSTIRNVAAGSPILVTPCVEGTRLDETNEDVFELRMDHDQFCRFFFAYILNPVAARGSQYIVVNAPPTGELPVFRVVRTPRNSEGATPNTDYLMSFGRLMAKPINKRVRKVISKINPVEVVRNWLSSLQRMRDRCVGLGGVFENMFNAVILHVSVSIRELIARLRWIQKSLQLSSATTLNYSCFKLLCAMEADVAQSLRLQNLFTPPEAMRTSERHRQLNELQLFNLEPRGVEINEAVTQVDVIAQSELEDTAYNAAATARQAREEARMQARRAAAGVSSGTSSPLNPGNVFQIQEVILEDEPRVEVTFLAATAASTGERSDAVELTSHARSQLRMALNATRPAQESAAAVAPVAGSPSAAEVSPAVVTLPGGVSSAAAAQDAVSAATPVTPTGDEVRSGPPIPTGPAPPPSDWLSTVIVAPPVDEAALRQYDDQGQMPVGSLLEIRDRTVGVDLPNLRAPVGSSLVLQELNERREVVRVLAVPWNRAIFLGRNAEALAKRAAEEGGDTDYFVLDRDNKRKTSGIHCKIHYDAVSESFIVTDSFSTNGTFYAAPGKRAYDFAGSKDRPKANTAIHVKGCLCLGALELQVQQLIVPPSVEEALSTVHVTPVVLHVVHGVQAGSFHALRATVVCRFGRADDNQRPGSLEDRWLVFDPSRKLSREHLAFNPMAMTVQNISKASVFIASLPPSTPFAPSMLTSETVKWRELSRYLTEGIAYGDIICCGTPTKDPTVLRVMDV